MPLTQARNKARLYSVPGTYNTIQIKGKKLTFNKKDFKIET